MRIAKWLHMESVRIQHNSARTKLSCIKKIQTVQVSLLCGLCFKGLLAWGEHGVKSQSKLPVNMASRH